MNRILRSIASATIALASLAAVPFKTAARTISASGASQLDTGKFVAPGKNPRRKYGSVKKRKPIIDPEKLRTMQAQAGIRPGMPRKQRRELGRKFAKSVAVAAQQDGVTVNLPRAQRRRIQKLTASLVGGEMKAAR